MHPGHSIRVVYLCCEAVDFRKSINGLSVLVEQTLKLNPFGEGLYLFINRQRNKLKGLYWHRNGFCLWHKRLEAEKFAWPKLSETETLTLSVQEFQWLLEGFDLWRHPPHQRLHYTSVA